MQLTCRGADEGGQAVPRFCSYVVIGHGQLCDSHDYVPVYENGDEYGTVYAPSAIGYWAQEDSSGSNRGREVCKGIIVSVGYPT